MPLIFKKRNLKKTFPLKIEGKHPDRLLEATKHEIRKYVRRQRRVPLPIGVDYWDFECKFGLDELQAETVHFATLTTLINRVAQEEASSFFLEMNAKAGIRQKKIENLLANKAEES